MAEEAHEAKSIPMGRISALGAEEKSSSSSGGCLPTLQGLPSDYASSDLEQVPSLTLWNVIVVLNKMLDNGFYKFGYLMGSYPRWTIALSLIFCALCSAGNILFYRITDDEYLWTPHGSQFVDQKLWIDANFPKDMRYETVVLTAPNVLTADFMRYLYKLNEAVEAATTADKKYTYSDLCVKDLSESADSPTCYQESLLKLWGMDGNIISNLTNADVREAVTREILHTNSSSKYKLLLSNITVDPSTGQVISSPALMNVWLLRHNGTKEKEQATFDPISGAWEESFIEIINGDQRPEGLPSGAKMLGVAERSFDDEIDGAVNSNLVILFTGCGMIFFYVAAVLGRMNSVQQRIVLSMMGLLVIGLSISASFGFCFYFGIFYADMHPVIPFLLLGIGVDDMFVIAQSLENLTKEQKRYSVGRRIALTMKNAGVSITVTSITDMAAFLIGSTTSLPILRAFCHFAASGVISVYIFAATFFVGCMALDEHRIDSLKVTPCGPRKAKTWTPNPFSQREYGRLFFEKVVSKVVFMKPVMALIIVTILTIFGVGVYGATQIETNYNPVWYMRKSSYQYKFYMDTDKYFPENGKRVQVYVGNIEYWKHLDELLEMDTLIQSSTFVREGSVSYWFSHFYREYCNVSSREGSVYDDPFVDDFFGDAFGDDSGDEGFDITGDDCSNELYFKQSFLYFLNSHRNYYPDLRFNVSLETASRSDLWAGRFDITASRMNFQHGVLPNTTVQIQAMEDIRHRLNGIRFENETFVSPIPYSFYYVQWEANQIISKELIRNLSLTFVTIVLVTLVFIADLRVSVMVLVSVVLTVSNVLGYAHFMGLTIEIVTSIILILCCGLALDYAAHIGVAYVCSKKTSRQDRAKDALTSMGSPVFHGGFSTFTAFVLLFTSESYVFSTFAEMFGMVVLFGLLHGIILIPIVLYMLGPERPNALPGPGQPANGITSAGPPCPQVPGTCSNNGGAQVSDRPLLGDSENDSV